MPPRQIALVAFAGATFLILTCQGCSARIPAPAPNNQVGLEKVNEETPTSGPEPGGKLPDPQDKKQFGQQQQQEINPPSEGSKPAPEQVPLEPSPWQAREGEDLPQHSSATMWGRLEHDVDLSWKDYQNYYTTRNMGLLALGIGLAAPIANTSADQSIRAWYQKQVRGETTDEFAQVINYAGQAWIALPLCLETAGLMGKAGADYANDSAWMEWSNRSLRSIAVGAPPMLLLYAVLGSSRPDRENSHWHPFQDTHGVSGHTFMGAVPFLTAADMVENPVLKSVLVAGSMLTGWSRLDLDRHYFSQIGLGWWMAYLAVRRVDQTQADQKYTLLPTCGEGPGVGVLIRY
jgi:hypothetical protein